MGLNEPIKAPPHRNLPILQKLIEAYKVWHGFLQNLDRPSRYTIGEKIDQLFTDVIEKSLIARYSANKTLAVKQTSQKLDLLKFFLQVAWELRILDNKKYTTISKPLMEAGKMLGGWLKQFSN